METESMRSGRSDRSERSQRSRGYTSEPGGRSHRSRHGSNGRHRQHRRDRNEQDTDRNENTTTTEQGDRPVSVNMPRQEIDVLTGLPLSTSGVPEERIEVQIMAQDDNWGETTTAITGATSEAAFSLDEMAAHKTLEQSIGFHCARYAGSVLAAIISLAAGASPVAMVVVPRLGLAEESWGKDGCSPECEGRLIGLAFKLLLLAIAAWAVFWRRPRATLPRVLLLRSLVMALAFLLLVAFWLFYGVRVWQASPYAETVRFAGALTDSLLWLHYAAVVLLALRHRQHSFTVKVLRSPDGESRTYNVGPLSIQRMAAWCLDRYYRDFSIYNPYLDSVRSSSTNGGKMSGFKFYDVDGSTSAASVGRSRAIFAAAARRRDSSHNDKFYEEQEYERRVRKRRARLLVAAEEAFTNIKRRQDELGPAVPMDSREAAQAIFPSMARALQKYLRITRQQPRHTTDSILNHLAVCLSHSLSPRAFLEVYLAQGPVLWCGRPAENGPETWTVVSERLVSGSADDGTTFQLRQGDVSLLISVRRLPHFNLTEAVLDPSKSNFVLRLNSETSV